MKRQQTGSLSELILRFGGLISGETTIVNDLQTVSSIHGDDSLEETVFPFFSEEWIFQHVKIERHDSNEKRSRCHLADYSRLRYRCQW
jgi:hypothetical protein